MPGEPMNKLAGIANATGIAASNLRNGACRRRVAAANRAHGARR